MLNIKKFKPFIQMLSHLSPFSIWTIIKIILRAWLRSYVFSMYLSLILKKNIIRLQTVYKDYFSIEVTVFLII